MPFLCRGEDTSKTEIAGDILQYAILVGAGTAALLEEHPETDKYQGAWELTQSMLTTTAITLALKAAVDKERPNGLCCESFPSGHTAISFAGATFIQQRYGLPYAIPAYLASAYVGYSRIYGNKHDISDVLGGAIIGTLSSYYFTTEYRGLRLQPQLTPSSAMLQISFDW